VLAVECGLKRQSICQGTLHITTTLHGVTSLTTVALLFTVCMGILKAYNSTLVILNNGKCKYVANEFDRKGYCGAKRKRCAIAELR
jgi:hypothetical protein